MGDERRRYTFPPLERRGVLLGLGAAQLATLAAGVIAALFVLRGGSSMGGLTAAGAVAAGAGVAACWPVAGRPPVSWVAVGGGWLRRRGAGPRLAPEPTEGRPTAGTAGAPAGAGLWGGTVGGNRWPVGGAGGGRRPAGTAVPGIEVRAASERPGDEPLGVVVDRWSGSWGAVLSVGGSSFALLDPGEKERRLGGWGRLLATLARPGSPVHRLQWVELTLPGSSDELARYLAEAGDERSPAYGSYRQMIEGAGPASERHRALLFVSVHPRRASRSLRSFGRGDDAVGQLLRREVRLLCGQLGNAELHGVRSFSVDDLVEVLSAGAGSEGRWRSPWPMATDEAWSALRADADWHATYWVSEWPRLDVGPDFLTPLMVCGGRRRVSLVMAPIDPQRAARQAGSARTADMADEELRRRVGFVPSVRRQREAEGVARREAELADGHGEYRFSGYVTVTAADRGELDQRCAEVEQAAQQAHLELRRLYGRQQEAWAWTLPLGRGLS